jgi:hypothetical protein
MNMLSYGDDQYTVYQRNMVPWPTLPWSSKATSNIVPHPAKVLADLRIHCQTQRRHTKGAITEEISLGIWVKPSLIAWRKVSLAPGLRIKGGRAWKYTRAIEQ